MWIKNFRQTNHQTHTHVVGFLSVDAITMFISWLLLLYLYIPIIYSDYILIIIYAGDLGKQSKLEVNGNTDWIKWYLNGYPFVRRVRSQKGVCFYQKLESLKFYRLNQSD